MGKTKQPAKRDRRPIAAIVAEARKALTMAARFEDVKDIRDEAEGLRAYAASVGAGMRAQNQCAEVRLRAERRLGGELADLEKNRGRPRKRSSGATVLPTLKELGIKKTQSSHWQAIARLADEDFETHIAEIIDAGDELTGRGIYALAKRFDRAAASAERRKIVPVSTIEDLNKLIAAGARYPTILADPPWQYETWGEAGEDRSEKRHYDTMPLGEIMKLPVDKLAEKHSVLLLWTTGPFLEKSFQVIHAWGFAYKAIGFAWAKLNPKSEGFFSGRGHWTRSNVELCLLATRGSPARIDEGVDELIVDHVRENSRKPDATHGRIEQLLDGPYLEVFGRQERKGWTVWGNETGKFNDDANDEGET